MKIETREFKGIVPAVTPRAMSPKNAQRAENTNLETGDLAAWSDLTDVKNIAGSIQTIYRFLDQYWFQWQKPVDAVRAPLVGEQDARVYFTGLDVPRFTDFVQAISGSGPYPANSYTLGIPAPVTGPTATVQGTITDDNPALVESRAYVYTFVSKYEEEGPPSAPSSIVQWAPGQTVKLSGFSAPTGEFVIQRIRIYRTASSGAATQFHFVDEVSVSTSTYTDSTATTDLGEAVPSQGWIAPPDDMHSLVALPNGSLAGASGLDVCISEQYLPHAWPLDYRHATDEPIVALGAMGSSIAVLTERKPYLITGAAPASMTMYEAGPADFACVSARGAASVPGLGVVYPAANGLVAITPDGARYLSREIITREQWRAYKPDTMIGIAHRGRYFGFYDGGCLVFDPGENLYELDLDIQGGYRHPDTDVLYVIRNSKIQEWNSAGTPFKQYYWKSKLYELPRPAVFSAARIRAESYADLTLVVYADRVQAASVAVTNERPLRLPLSQLAYQWEFELVGTDTVHTVELAERIDEM